MHSRDITEILKVFEKRITKLEKRVEELESEIEEISSNQTARSAIHPKSEEYHDDISVQTTAYNFGGNNGGTQRTNGKVVFDKGTLLRSSKG